MRGKSRFSGTAWVAVTIAVSVLACGTAARADENNQVAPVTETYGGLSYGDWAAAWWQWALQIPAAADHPFFPGGNTLLAQSGPVWFLAGVFGTEVRNITIPSGIALFFPVINAECSIFEPPPFHGDDPASLATCANTFLDQAENLSAEIDGRKVKNIEQYRVRSPMFTVGPLPDPNILGAPKNTITQSVDAGVYLLVSPLKPGRHTIHFKGSFAGNGTIDTTYKITVKP
jgi:hypothetical protein